jgi:hypothetical protein
MTIETFTPAVCKLLAAEIETTLQDLADIHDLKITAGAGSYRGQLFSLKIECVASKDGEWLDADAVAFKQMAHLYGLNPADLGRMFTHNGKQYQIAGARPRSRKYPILARKAGSDGGASRYKFPARAVQRALHPEQIGTKEVGDPRFPT